MEANTVSICGKRSPGSKKSVEQRLQEHLNKSTIESDLDRSGVQCCVSPIVAEVTIKKDLKNHNKDPEESKQSHKGVSRTICCRARWSGDVVSTRKRKRKINPLFSCVDVTSAKCRSYIRSLLDLHAIK